MTEALFSISAAFLGYVIYTLVGEQVKVNKQVAQTEPAQPAPVPEMSLKPSAPAKASKAKAAPKAKTAPAAKASPAPKAKATLKPKAAPKAKKVVVPAVLSDTANTVKTYLETNGATTVAKMTKELSVGKKAMQTDLDELAEKNIINLITIGRAKGVELKA